MTNSRIYCWGHRAGQRTTEKRKSTVNNPMRKKLSKADKGPGT